MARTAARIGAVIAVGAVLALVAIPAQAATGDITGDKTNDGGPVANGESVGYEVLLENPSANYQTNVVVEDDMEFGLVYIPESTGVYVRTYTQGTVAFDSLPPDGVNLRTNYFFGTGWNGDWTEHNDAASDPATGFIQWNGGIDQNSIRLGGLASPLPGDYDPLDDSPAIYRDIHPDALVGVLDAELTFHTSNPAGMTADQKMAVWISVEGDPYTLAAEYDAVASGADVIDTDRTLDLSPYLPADNLRLRFGTSAGTFTGTQYLALDDVSINGVWDDTAYMDNWLTSGNPQLDDGTPGALLTTADSVDLPGEIVFDGETYTSYLYIWYYAWVDTSQTTNWDTELGNGVAWRSDAYTNIDDFNYDYSYIDVLYDPALDLTVSSNGPLVVGQPVVITVVLKHGDTSDGSPVCATDVDILELPAGAVSGSFTGDTEPDECLDLGETWTFVITYPPFATSGNFPFAVAFEGATINAEDNEGDLEVDLLAEGDTTVTVTLAATGAASGSAAGWAATLIALGTAALVIARRRIA